MPFKFFDESREQSRIKAEIVEKYFYVWARIVTSTQNRSRITREHRIGYVDLFAGPGRYEDGAASTPLRVLQKAVEDPVFRDRLVTIFNDKDEEHVRKLEAAIHEIPGIDLLRYQPEIWNEEVGSEMAKAIDRVEGFPILAFIDPWGYKGLSLQLVNQFLANWGCDCIFFFNYNRINMGLSNPLVREHMTALFGEERAANLARQISVLEPQAREATVVNELSGALRSYGHRYVLPFCFKTESGTRTSHHLILVSDNFKAYEVMKDIMAGYSSDTSQGVPSFTYSPAADHSQGLLFELNRPLDDLKAMLLRDYRGRTTTRDDIYEEHSIDRPYIKKNYTAVLTQLEDEGAIIVRRPRRGRPGFGRKTKITFPM